MLASVPCKCCKCAVVVLKRRQDFLDLRLRDCVCTRTRYISYCHHVLRCPSPLPLFEKAT